ncbi:hypothetical protein ABZU32_39630 [Sphaerisporangium sp. NPDC005288]|uniref:hypothetical protein n=1 Tax=Sphaerisporangium sp. NPDC005288 TaxID=3155114 RepID=UPI0033B9A2B5
MKLTGETYTAACEALKKFEALRPLNAAMHIARLVPLEAFSGYQQRLSVACEPHGHVTATTAAVLIRGTGCRLCGRSRLRLELDQAIALMLEAGLVPLEPYPGASARWRCRCATCASIVTPRFANIRVGQGGCMYCARARRQSDLGRPALLEVVSHPEDGRVMIGINLRLMPGWVRLATIDCSRGVAREILRHLLDHFRDRGIEPVRQESWNIAPDWALTLSQDEIPAHDIAGQVQRIALELQSIGQEPREGVG